MYDLAKVKEERSKLISDNHFLAVDNKELSEKLTIAERKLEDYSF